MNKNQNWDDLGRRIQYEVDRAVNSRDFQNMAKNIRQVVDAAAGAGTEAVRRAAQTVQSKAVSVQDLYGKTGGKVIGGILKTWFGFCGTFFFGLATAGFIVAGELLNTLPAAVSTT